MKSSKTTMTAVAGNRILLGFLMLIPGLSKLFVMGPTAVTGFLAGLGFPAAAFFAWILIIAEVLSGLAILFNYKMHLSTIPPMIILLVAGILTFSVQGLPLFLMHLTLVTNYWVFWAYAANEK